MKRLLAADAGADAGADTSNLKLIVYGGGPMYVEDTLAALERFGPKLSQLYGQGESPMTITALPAAVHAEREHPRWRERLASVGTPQSVVEVRVAGEHDEPLAARRDGRDPGAGGLRDVRVLEQRRPRARRRFGEAGSTPATSGSSTKRAFSPSRTVPRT